MGCLLKAGGGLYSRLAVGAVLLAAGAGMRMGRRPKSLLQLGGVPLIRRQLIALSGAGVDEVVVVLGHHADAIEPLVADFPVTLVRNPDPDAGQAGSLRIGLAALTSRVDAVLVALADQPLVDAHDVNALIGAYKRRGTHELVVPQVAGEPGHPLIFSADLRQQILAGEASVGCRQWRAAHPEQVMAYETDNRHYVVDLDSEEDLTRFEQRYGHRLRWPAEAA
ncbi:MAG: nucleotidyltransferase family protein [Proteobacteria bacterium]|nr:nucleotidyltransferase family protein [Pseudomonadota bacterium]